MTQATHQITGCRFGVIEFTDEDVVFFPKGLVGLNNLQRFVVLNLKADSPFRWLQSCDEPAFALLMTEPGAYVEGYEPSLGKQSLEEVSLQPDKPKLVFVTATIPAGQPQKMTLNLRGPIVINAENRLATQCILDDETYTTKYRVFAQSESDNEVAA